jgi:hypothetical protein
MELLAFIENFADSSSLDILTPTAYIYPCLKTAGDGTYIKDILQKRASVLNWFRQACNRNIIPTKQKTSQLKIKPWGIKFCEGLFVAKD